MPKIIISAIILILSVSTYQTVAETDYHDGCTRQGATCQCPQTRWQGICTKGSHYGNSSVYCVCESPKK